MAHPDVVDTAVVGVPDSTKGEVPLCLYIMRPGTDSCQASSGSMDRGNARVRVRTSSFLCTEATKNEEEINEELVQRVRSLIGPIASFKTAAAVTALPRTRSGKIIRKSIATLARSKLVKVDPNDTVHE